MGSGMGAPSTARDAVQKLQSRATRMTTMRHLSGSLGNLYNLVKGMVTFFK